MDACIYQRVAVPVNTILSLQADVHAWCSNSDNPAACDGEFYFRVGIDVAGIEGPFPDPPADTLFWGDWIRATNEYQTIEMQAIAHDPNVTVYIAFWNKYRYAHNDAYIDAARLLVEKPEPEPEPEPSKYVTREELIRLIRSTADKLEAYTLFQRTS